MERWNSPCLAYETHVNTDFYTRTVTKWTRCRELIVLSHKWHFARIPFHCLPFLLFVYFLLRQVGILLHVLEEMQTQVRAAYSGTTLCWSQSFSKWRKWLLRSQTPAVCRGNPFPLHTHTHTLTSAESSQIRSMTSSADKNMRVIALLGETSK